MDTEHADDRANLKAEIERLQAYVQRLQTRQHSPGPQDQHFEALHAIARALIGRQDTDQVLNIVMDHALEITGATDGFAQLVVGEPARIEGKAVRGLYVTPPVPYPTPREGLVGVVLEKSHLMVVEDYDVWPLRRSVWPQGQVRSVVAIPFHGKTHVLGVLAISFPTPGPHFPADVCRVLQAMADLASIAIEQARLREELDSSRYFAEQVARTVPSILYVHDLIERRNLYVNEAMMHLLGYSEAEVQALGGDLLPSIVHPDDIQHVIDENDKMRAGDANTSIDLEYRVRHANGSWRWLRSRDRVFRVDDEGRPVQSVGSAQDITVERNARDSLRYQARLLDTVADAVISADAQFAIRSWNRGAERMYGWREGEVIGKNVGEMLQSSPAASNPDSFDEIISKLFAEGMYEGEFINIARDGRQIIQWTKTSLVYDDQGQVIGSVAVNRDITEQKWAEAALRESEMRFRALFDKAPVGIVIARLGRVLESNAMMSTITGYSTDELRDMDYRDITHPEDIALELPLVEQLVNGDIDSYQLEKRYLHAEGHEVWVRIHGSLLKLPDKDLGMVMVEDITQRRQAEAHEREIQRERGRIQVLANFVRDASHDFRTPLSTMYTSLYMLQRTGEDAQRRDHHLSVLQHQAEHLERLVEGLFTMARLDATDQLILGRLNLDDLLAEIADKVRSRREKPYENIAYERVPDLPYVMADGAELNRAVLQIIDNAISFSPPGGPIQVAAQNTGEEVLVTIRDSGIGIAQEDLPHIFERFYRADKARTRGGLGLGLAIAQKIVEKHNGRITVDSTPGNGTTVSIYLLPASS